MEGAALPGRGGRGGGGKLSIESFKNTVKYICGHT